MQKNGAPIKTFNFPLSTINYFIYLCSVMSGKASIEDKEFLERKALLERIAKGTARLIADNRRLKSEVERSEAAREKLREENRRLVLENAALERRAAVRDLAAGFSGEARTADRHGTKIARARVNRLMREVDRCIALLNKE